MRSGLVAQLLPRSGGVGDDDGRGSICSVDAFDSRSIGAQSHNRHASLHGVADEPPLYSAWSTLLGRNSSGSRLPIGQQLDGAAALQAPAIAQCRSSEIKAVQSIVSLRALVSWQVFSLFSFSLSFPSCLPRQHFSRDIITSRH